MTQRNERKYDTSCLDRESPCLENLSSQDTLSPARTHFKPEIPNLRFNSGIIYATAKAVEYLKQGIGQSRRSYKKSMGRVPYIHSYETLTRYVGIFNNFKDTVLIPEGANKIHKISTNHIDIHFKNLLDKNCSEKTIASNASALNKFFYAFGRYDLVRYTNSLRPLWKSLSAAPLKTKPFTNPEKVIKTMRSPYREGAIIQYLTGARVSDIRKVYEWVKENPESEIIFIRKSKGGRNRTINYSERPVALALVKNAVLKLDMHYGSRIDWLLYMKEYTTEVRNAAKKCGEIYSGTHAFRVNYANERYIQLSKEDDNFTEREKVILSIITEELGHSRIPMARYYIHSQR
ncbi:MAG: site-specific integrase [Deltaproteobacteria bacterium]|nr:site-specific integrase [Deltaproteobacteria bacterium]